MASKESTPKALPSQATAPAGSKMRSSCQACADSKIGCTKERPTCSRCERRKMTCIYMATKRAGRPAKNKRPNSPPPQPDAAAERAPSAPPASTSPSSRSSCIDWSSEAMSEHTNTSTPPPSMPDPMDSMDWCFSGYPSLFEGMSNSGFEKDGFISTHPSLAQPLAQLLTLSPPPLLTDEDLNIDLDAFLAHPTMDFTQLDKAALAQQDDFSMQLPPVSEFHNPFLVDMPNESFDWFAVSSAPHGNITATATANEGPSSPTSAFEPHTSGSCLALSLKLLEELTPHWTAAPCHQNKAKDAKPISTSFESVVAQNQAAMDTIDKILQCPCSRNSIVLFSLALVLFKMLGWYTACVNSTLHMSKEQDSSYAMPATPPRVAGRRSSIVRRPTQLTLLEYESDVGYADRIVCQIILSKLSSVRQTLNILTERLTAKNHGDRALLNSGFHDEGSGTTESLLIDGPVFHSSHHSDLGHSLAMTLKHHIHELCKNIVQTLSET